MIGNLLQTEIEELIRSQNWGELRIALEALDPPDVADLIIDLPPEDEGVIFRVLPRERAAMVFSYLPHDQQEGLLHSLSSETSTSIIESMPPDDRARLLEEMPAEVTRRLLAALSPEELKATRRILGYPEDSAGRYMTPEYVALRPDMTAQEALDHVRATGKQAETLNFLYVVENGKLINDLRLGALVMASPSVLLRDLPERAHVAIPATATREDMVAGFEKYDRAALPVTDAQGNMLGIITADDVLEVAEEITTEDMQKMGGTEALDAPYFSVGFWEMARKRGGWLAILFLGEMLTATAMGYFEGEIEKAAVVALFVPLIISSGGNSGSQGTSIIIRSLALKEIRLREWYRVFGRELRTGLALGCFLGLIGFVRISAWQGLSQVPAIGTFFQTHGEKSMANAPAGLKFVSTDLKLESEIVVPAYTLPIGSELQKGQLLPSATPLPASAEHTESQPTAYGKHWLLIGLTVFFALIGVVAWGSLAGSMLPFVLRSIGFDPATSSAPFVATLVDVTGLIIYFLVAKIILTGTLL